MPQVGGMKIGKHLEIPHAWLLYLPWLLFAIGFIMNAVAMVSNHNLMPVYAPGGYCSEPMVSHDGLHVCMTTDSHLKILSDWAVVPTLGTASIGDLFEWVSDILFQPLLGAWCMAAWLKIKDK